MGSCVGRMPKLESAGSHTSKLRTWGREVRRGRLVPQFVAGGQDGTDARRLQGSGSAAPAPSPRPRIPTPHTTHRFLMVTRCRENLSSGEKRAGCADLDGLPATTFLTV